MRGALFACLVALLLILTGCAAKDASTHGATQQPKSIGAAWLETDGTLVMQLRAETPGKALGDALLRYKPDDPAYHRMLDHVGPLKPGETKPVPPFPEEQPARSR
jgi:hypothetical protein